MRLIYEAALAVLWLVRPLFAICLPMRRSLLRRRAARADGEKIWKNGRPNGIAQVYTT